MSAELRGIPPLKSPKYERIRLIKEKVFTMGRFAGASLPILDVKVSRKPAVFEFHQGNWTLMDKASMNGVFLNDSPIPSQEAVILNHGDVIKLGPLADYRWIFFLEEEPPRKRTKEGGGGDMETQILESMEKIEQERLCLEEELKASEASAQELLSRKVTLSKNCKERQEELSLKEASQKEDIIRKIQDVSEREQRLDELEKRLLQEKREMVTKSSEDMEAVDAQISAKMKLLEENRRTISVLKDEKAEAEECLEREKKLFEEKISLLKEEYDRQTKSEESYESAYKRLSDEMEDKLRAGCHKIEALIEKEKREKESLKVEFEEMKVQSSRAQQRLEDVMGTCEEEFKCTICDEIFIKPVTTNCGHVFCEYCIYKWKGKQEQKEDAASCPNCRLPITSVSKNYYLENLIDSLVQKFGEDIQNQRDKMSSERKEDALNGEKSKAEVKPIHPLMLAAAANRASRRKKRKRS